MAERIPANAGGTQYFKSMYSGLRAMISPYKSNSVEDANNSASTIANKIQGSDHEIEMIGNPHLMYDLQRLPTTAIPIAPTGKYNL